jgi:hypothetical protein
MNLNRNSFGPAALLAFACVVASACSDGADSTTGRRIVLGTTITAGSEASEPFTNAQGWTIQFYKLLLSTGAFYYFDGATLFSQSEVEANRTYQMLERFIGVRSAFAHPGHYVPGTARGQLLHGVTVDLHAGPAELAMAEGVTGLVRSATFSFGTPPQGELANEMESHVALIEGIAKKGAEVRVFRAEIGASDVLSAKRIPAIEGCPFTTADMQDDGSVTLAIQLPIWFDQVEFDALPASTDGKPVLVPESSIAHHQLARGMKKGNAYVFSYSKGFKGLEK